MRMWSMQSVKSLGFSAAIVALAGTAWLTAGPLDPPAGPVASTYKTLSEVEPRIAINQTNTPGDADSLFRIDKPGSYYLTGNVVGVSGKHGIKIANHDVTIDLNGFALIGATGSLDGVTSFNTPDNLTIRNGSVDAWGGRGIGLTSAGAGAIIEGVIASSNGGGGIGVGVNAVIRGCAVNNNANVGILAGNAATVANCSARSNTLHGIQVDTGSTVVASVARLNDGDGFVIDSGSSILNSNAYDNGSDGIAMSNDCSANNCTARSNTANGFDAGGNCTITNCVSSTNTGGGFNTSGGCTISLSTAASNQADGISTNTGCTVVQCTSVSNTADGIRVSSACIVRGNTCRNNGSGTGNGAGIHATSSDNRIEDNNSIGADRGIDVDSGGNIIIRNTCSGNAVQWDISANNVVGPILDRTAPGSGAINGSSAPSSLGTTEPNANFTY